MVCAGLVELLQQQLAVPREGLFLGDDAADQHRGLGLGTVEALAEVADLQLQGLVADARGLVAWPVAGAAAVFAFELVAEREGQRVVAPPRRGVQQQFLVQRARHTRCAVLVALVRGVVDLVRDVVFQAANVPLQLLQVRVLRVHVVVDVRHGLEQQLPLRLHLLRPLHQRLLRLHAAPRFLAQPVLGRPNVRARVVHLDRQLAVEPGQSVQRVQYQVRPLNVDQRGVGRHRPRPRCRSNDGGCQNVDVPTIDFVRALFTVESTNDFQPGS